MKLSIIIPIYRTQDTLKRCIESVLGQSFTDYELILVDDGSPDLCPQICDDYARQDERIIVIHKENGGLSDARNAGIKQAKGEYITFIDSDDAIAENTLEPLVCEIKKHPLTDILEYPIMERIGHPKKEMLLSFEPKEYTSSWEYWLKEKAYNHTYAWNKLFRRSLFENISFPKGKNFEDALTIPLLIGLIPTENQKKNIRIRTTNKGCYQYYWNPQGITAKAEYKDLRNLYIGQTLALIHLFKYIKEQEKEKTGKKQEVILKEYALEMEEFLLRILNILLDLYDLSGEYEPHPPLISRARWLGDRQNISSIKLKLLNILGYHQLCKLNHLIHRIYRHH